MAPIQTKLIDVNLLTQGEVKYLQMYLQLVTKKLNEHPLLLCKDELSNQNLQIEWLNTYHEKVRTNLTPLLGDDANVIEWLGNQTKSIGSNVTDGNEIDNKLSN